MTNSNFHVGSSFDDFLEEDNLLGQANEIAVKKVESALEILKAIRRYQQDKLTLGLDRVEQYLE